jgi:hypothetical protein
MSLPAGLQILGAVVLLGAGGLFVYSLMGTDGVSERDRDDDRGKKRKKEKEVKQLPPTRMRVVTASSLKVRDQPSDGEIVNVLPYGTEVRTSPTQLYETHEEITEAWHLVEDYGGYVFGGFLGEVDDRLNEDKEMVLIQAIKTQYSHSSDQLSMSQGKAQRVVSRWEEGGEGLEYTQDGTYLVTSYSIEVTLEPTTGTAYHSGDEYPDEPIQGESLSLSYDERFRGWPSDQVRSLERERSWKLDAHRRALINKEPCVYERGICENLLEYWHTPRD